MRLATATYLTLCLGAAGCADSLPTEVAPGKPSLVIVGTYPGSATAGTSLQVAVQVTGLSQPNGQLVNFVVLAGNGSVQVPAVVSAKPSSGPGAGQQGIATTIWFVGTQAGTAILEARLVNSSTGSVLSMGQFQVTVMRSALSGIRAVQGDSQTATAGTPTAHPVGVRAVDGYGNPVAGATINWAVDAGGGTIGTGQTATTSVTDASGLATMTWTLGTVAGTNRMRGYVLIGGIAYAAFFTAVGTPATATVIQTAQRIFSPAVGSTIRPTVRVTDANGNGVTGVAVTFTVLTGGGALDGVGTLARLTDASGQASVDWTVGARVASNTLQATVQGLQGGPIRFVAIPYACDCWSARTPMPTVRRDFGSGLLNGQAYTGGGSNNQVSPYFATVELYDPAANTWSSGTPLPTAYAFPTGGVVNGVWYLASGFGPSGLTSVLRAFDPGLGTWQSRAPIPTARIETASGVVGNLMYVVGGDYTGNGTPTGANEAYDPALDQWTSRAPLPVARYLAGGAALGGRLFVVGGVGANAGGSGASIHDRLDIYDPAANAWTAGAPMPTARYGATVAALNGLLFVIGGHNPGNLATVEVYDPATDVWLARTPMPTARGGAAGIVFNGVIHVIGGRDDTGAQSFGANEMYRP